MAKPSDHPGFKQLLADWNKKLKQSGLVDVEEQLHPSGTQIRFRRLDPQSRQNKLDYFRLVAQHVADTTFESGLEGKILTMYAEGYTQACIKRELQIPGHRCKVYYPIYRWLRIWGLK